MDASAIQAIIDLATVKYTVHETGDGMLVPKSAEMISVERFLSQPTRFRRAFTTRRIGDFISYAQEHGTVETAVFIAPDLSRVVAVLNHGNVTAPQWGDNTAALDLQHEPEFRAFFDRSKGAISQRDLIEYFEDWLPTGYVTAIDTEGMPIAPNAAISAARRVTISAKSEATHQQADMRASRSALEEIEARGAEDNLPYGLRFVGMVFHGLTQYTITARLGIRLTDKEPMFTLRLVGWEAQLAQICNDAEDLLRKKLAGFPVYIGASLGTYAR